MNRFVTWLSEAEVGDVIMYLQADTASRNPAIQKLFFDAAKEGKVFLYQKRVRYGVFNYYAKRITAEAGAKLKPEEYEYE